VTLNQLHKVLGKLIAKGHGRRQVTVAKESFTDNRESDGCTILPISAVDLRWVLMADDDGGIAVRKDGRERGSTQVVLGGCAYEKSGEYTSREEG
jgi:hypothetical protein